MIKFPEIGQFRNAVREVQARARFAGHDDIGAPIFNEDAEMPVIQYRGTVKLHGTNAAVRIEDDRIVAQSRSRDLAVGDDHHQWAVRVAEIPDSFWRQTAGRYQIIYGEHCGQGIMGGVGVNQLDKMFVVFALRDHEGNWAPPEDVARIWSPEHRIFNTERVGYYAEALIDFSNPQASLEMMETLTLSVEKKCPFASHFDVQGIGEGIVWRPTDPNWQQGRFWFKTKGQKHSERKKRVKITIAPEVMASIEEFVSETLVEARLLKGVAYLQESGSGVEVSRKHTGGFIQWISKDILKEESDVLEASGLEWKDVVKKVQRQARVWLFKHIDSQL